LSGDVGKKELVISGGYDIYPQEIESLLYTHPLAAGDQLERACADLSACLGHTIMTLRELRFLPQAAQ